MSLLRQQEDRRETLLQQRQQRRETCGGKLLEVGGQKVLIDVNFHRVAVSLLVSTRMRHPEYQVVSCSSCPLCSVLTDLGVAGVSAGGRLPQIMFS